MKFVLLLLLLGVASALEREQDFAVSAEAEVSPGEEFLTTTLKPNVKEDDDEETNNEDDKVIDDKDEIPVECSPALCSVVFRRSTCRQAIALPNNRCGCICPAHIDPHELFRRIFGGRPFARPTITFPELPEFPDLTPKFDDPFKRSPGLFNSWGMGGFASGVSKVYFTMQQSCEVPEDCSGVCQNCTTVNCVNSFCQCLACPGCQTEINSRRLPEPQTCSIARDCLASCEGCEKVGCRYGECVCSRCNDSSSSTTTPAAPEITSDSASSTDAESTTPSASTTTSGSSVETPGETTPAAERISAEPTQVNVLVRGSDGKDAKVDDTNRYEIIF